MRIYKNIFKALLACTFSFGALFSPLSAKAQEEIPAAPSSPEIRGELWTGSLYSSKYRAGVCIDTDGKTHGVLILTLKDGKEDVYHFHGTKDIHGILRLKHSSGHKFKGHFASATSIEGKVTTKNGFTVKLKGHRAQNILLNGPSCRPF